MREQVEKIMEALDCTREEAEQVIADDKAINKGENLFELNKEQKKASKQARSTSTRKPTVYKFDTQTHRKKEDTDKTELMQMIAGTLQSQTADFEITKSGECVFHYHNRKFKIVLSAPRT